MVKCDHSSDVSSLVLALVLSWPKGPSDWSLSLALRPLALALALSPLALALRPLALVLALVLRPLALALALALKELALLTNLIHNC